MVRSLSLILIIFFPTLIVLGQSAHVVSDGYINGEFEGWDGETVFEMSDGSFWIQGDYSYRYEYAYNPEAVVFDYNGGYFLKVEDIAELLPVLPLDKVIKSRIDGNFEGFEGETVYKMTNGTIWIQTDGRYKYKYAYSPQVLLYKLDATWKLAVKGITVSVEQLR